MASTKSAIYAAMAGNFAIAVTKFIAAAIGGSSAMLTEGIHSVVDTGDAALLLLGQKASRRPPDRRHPFGHGKEVYFYSLIVAVLIFGVGGGVSIYEGMLHVMRPEPIRDPGMSYIVLGIAAVFEGISWGFALRTFSKARNGRSIWRTMVATKDPTTFAVLLEDSAALVGIGFAAAGVFVSTHFRTPVFDGIASIAIGLTLCAVAAVLLRETKGLLIGEAALPEVVDRIRHAAGSDPAVREVGRLMTMQLGPETVLVTVDLVFRNEAVPDAFAETIDRIESNIRTAVPAVQNVFIEAESMTTSR